MSFPLDIPRTVRPREPGSSWLPLIVVDEQARTIYIERTGELKPLSDLKRVLMYEPPSYWIACNFSGLLAKMNDLMADLSTWQFRGSPRKRELYNAMGPTGGLKTSDFIVAFFGFQSTDKKKKGHYHYPIDPSVFMRRYTDVIGGGGIANLLRWGKDVREWCCSEGLQPKPTAGGIAGQLLRDPRFYSVARRKVPKATNSHARKALPGNHYRLYAPESRRYQSAVYLDLTSAHHQAALNITFPHADNLYARGNFHIDDSTFENPDPNTAWCKPGSKLYRNLLTRAHGLLLVHLTVPTMPPGAYPLPYLETPGRRLAWVHTNELLDLLESRAIVEGIEAAWVSFKADTGLNRYAAWALAQTAAATEDRKAWLKPVLLSTYGILASKPRALEFAYGKAKGGEKKRYPAGGALITAYARCGDHENEMGTANVIHRGMIEAQTRLEVLRLARYLHASGANVLSVYADTVIVENRGQLPLIPAPWRSKGTLTNLRFYNATSFTSDQLTKMPGMPIESRQRQERIEQLRRIMRSATVVPTAQTVPDQTTIQEDVPS